MTEQVLETALEAELTDHLGYQPGDRDAKVGSKERDGTRTKTVVTEIGPVEVGVPRDRDATFAPVIGKKRQRRLEGVDELVLSLTARGLTTGEIAAHLAEVYGVQAWQGHDQPDHREGHWGDGRMADQAPGCRLPGDLSDSSPCFWNRDQSM